MICPACKNPMIAVEYNRIELDYCTHCHGVWFDADELELMLGSMGLADHDLSLDSILHAPEARTAEEKRKCPICNQKMKKRALGHETEVLIDACPKGDGLWFDGGEVNHLLKQVAKGPLKKEGSGQPVTDFLREVFQAQE
jgi:Zn-finger nucleic acid-binding protein